jgi:Ser/Thr protein kinase RdoA (MazF antagonist)
MHGDTNENNAILHGDRVGFIDFDRASVGSAGSDLGNFLGLLRYYRILRLMSAGAATGREDAFLSGYSSVRALPPPPALQVHIAIGLAERAIRAVTRVRPEALICIPSLVREASAALRGDR